MLSQLLYFWVLFKDIVFSIALEPRFYIFLIVFLDTYLFLVLSGHVPHSLFPYNITTNIRLWLYVLTSFLSLLFLQTACIVYKHSVYYGNLYSNDLKNLVPLALAPNFTKDAFELLYNDMKAKTVIGKDEVSIEERPAFYSLFNVAPNPDKYDVVIVQKLIDKYKLVNENAYFNKDLIAADLLTLGNMQASIN